MKRRCSVCGNKREHGEVHKFSGDRGFFEGLFDRLPKEITETFVCDKCIAEIIVLSKAYARRKVKELKLKVSELENEIDGIESKHRKKLNALRKVIEENDYVYDRVTSRVKVVVGEREVLKKALAKSAKDIGDARRNIKELMKYVKAYNDLSKEHEKLLAHGAEVLSERDILKKQIDILVPQVTRLTVVLDRYEQDLKHYDKLYKYDKTLTKVKRELKKVMVIGNKEFKIEGEENEVEN